MSCHADNNNDFVNNGGPPLLFIFPYMSQQCVLGSQVADNPSTTSCHAMPLPIAIQEIVYPDLCHVSFRLLLWQAVSITGAGHLCGRDRANLGNMGRRLGRLLPRLLGRRLQTWCVHCLVGTSPVACDTYSQHALLAGMSYGHCTTLVLFCVIGSSCPCQCCRRHFHTSLCATVLHIDSTASKQCMPWYPLRWRMKRERVPFTGRGSRYICFCAGYGYSSGGVVINNNNSMPLLPGSTAVLPAEM